MEQEREGLKKRHVPNWHVTYEPTFTSEKWMNSASNYRVAILREEVWSPLW